MKRISLAARRKVVGLSQEALAEELQVDVSTVRRWEYGLRQPQPWQRQNLATVLKVTLEELDELLTADQPRAQPDLPTRPSTEESSERPVTPYFEAFVQSTAYGSVERFVRVVAPNLSQGKLSTHEHLRPCAAASTLEELGILGRIDMLTRRETLAELIAAVSGPALLAPIAHWLATQPGRLEPPDHATRRIGASDVEAIERSTRFFAATDAEIGGALSREAAVGQLKYAIDLARHATYGEAVGNRLLAAIAELSGLVGYISHDSGMPGPAQRYFTYGLQAARESTAPRAKLLVVSILADMGEHARWLGHIETALQLQDLALDRLPADPRLDALRSLLIARRVGNALCHLGPSRLPEVKDQLSRSFDLCGQASDEDRADASTMWHRTMDISETELSVSAAVSYLVMAEHDPRLAAEAEKYTLAQIASVPEGQSRSKAFGQIRLARIRFLAGEVEQACDDGAQALHMAASMKSTTMQLRLRELLAGSEPYAEMTRVVEFRDRLRGAIAGLN